MAEREATIVIRYVGDTADAKAAYDDLRKHAQQNPIGAAVAGSRVGETATFAGGGTNAPVGGLMPVRASAPSAGSPGEQGINAAVSRMHAGFGGTGFSAPTLPTGTAYVNSVYGSVGASQAVGAFGSIASMAAFGADSQRASARMLGEMGLARTPRDWQWGRGSPVSGGAMVPFGAGIDDVEGEIVGALATSAPAPRQPRKATGAAAAQRRAMQKRETRSGGYAIRGIGAVGTFAYMAATTTNRYMTEAQEIRESLRYDDVATAADSAYQAARSADSFQRFGGRVGNWFSPGTFNDGTNIDEARDASVAARANVEAAVISRGNAAMGRGIDAMGYRGPSAAIAEARNSAQSEIDELNAQIKARGNANSNDLYERKGLVERRRNEQVNQIAEDYRRDTMFRTSSNIAQAAGLRGDSFGATIGGIDAQEMRERLEFEKMRPLLSVADQAAASGALSDDFRMQREGAAQSYRRGMRSEAGSLRGAGLRRAFDPYGGMRAESTAAFNADTVLADGSTMDPSRVEYQRANARFESRNADIAQSEALARLDTSRGLGFESLSLSRMLGRDPVGASAYATAGAGIDRIQQLARGGFGDLAERARTNTMSQLALTQQDYGLSFRATELDARNLSLSNPRDTTDPAQVIGAINDARKAVRDANANEGRDDSTGINGGGFDFNRFETSMEAAFSRALEANVAN